jgi:hypothetical protein
MRRPVPTLTATAAAAALLLMGVSAQAAPCDYMTGMGWFKTTAGQTHSLAKATFDIAGGCKYGSPTWGHLDYMDKGNGLRLRWTSMTAYIWGDNDAPDPKTGQPHGTRYICGKATTNLYGVVDFGVVAHDASEPGRYDVFIIRLRNSAGITVYSTENPQEDFTLGSTGSGGGNLQLYKPNPMNPGSFSDSSSCPAFF